MLGDWDPSKCVPMQWTDGDYWTAELSVTPGQSLEMEYKYIVIGADGLVDRWMDGDNYQVRVPVVRESRKVTDEVRVSDAWDQSFKQIDIEVGSQHGSQPDQHSSASITGELTAEAEQRLIQAATDKAMSELQTAMQQHQETLQKLQDPAAIEVLIADRLLAVANNKAVAFSRALKAAESSSMGLLAGPSQTS